MTDPPAPTPGYCHPYYERWREVLLQAMSTPHRRAYVIPRLPEVLRPWSTGDLMDDSATELPPRDCLTLRICRGLAPYVGDPFSYEWQVYVDERGRCVAGEARIVPGRFYR